MLTRYQAVELAGHRLPVNTIMGGATDGDFGGGTMRTDYVQKASAEAIALGRMGTADDLGAAVPAILSGAFAWANGGINSTGGRAYSAPTGRPRRDRLISPRPVVQLALPFTAAGQPCMMISALPASCS